MDTDDLAALLLLLSLVNWLAAGVAVTAGVAAMLLGELAERANRRRWYLDVAVAALILTAVVAAIGTVAGLLIGLI